MHEEINVLGLTIPTYGLMIILGIIVANIVAAIFIKKLNVKYNELFIIEAYGILGGFIGSKLVFAIVSFKDINWQEVATWDGFRSFMSNGFVFYGGLIMAFLLMMLAGKIHHIDVWNVLRKFIFMIPIMHCFGRIGCYLSGCCYGKPYDGIGAVIYPDNSSAPSGIKLFPVQLVEAAIVLIIAIILIILEVKKDFYYTIEAYLLSYSVVRFILEYYRYDSYRGIYYGLSTSQWISITIFVGTLISIIFRKKKNNVSEER